MQLHFADMTAAQVMGLAIDMERGNSVRYSIVRDYFADDAPQLASLFDELSEEEHAHLEILRKVAAVMFPDGVPEVSVDDVAEIPERWNVDPRRIRSDGLSCRDALLAAIQVEVSAYSMYRRAKRVTDNRELKRVYSTLAGLEKEHRAVLASWVARYDGEE